MEMKVLYDKSINSFREQNKFDKILIKKLKVVKRGRFFDCHNL